MHLQLGNLAEWLAAIGTISAVWYAVTGSRREARLREQADEARSAYQASRVTTRLEAEYNNARLDVIVLNDGDRTVHDVTGDVTDVATGILTYELPTHRALDPGTEARAVVQQQERRGTVSEWAVRLRFVDHDGVAWIRDVDHRVHRDLPLVVKRRWWRGGGKSRRVVDD